MTKKCALFLLITIGLLPTTTLFAADKSPSPRRQTPPPRRFSSSPVIDELADIADQQTMENLIADANELKLNDPRKGARSDFSRNTASSQSLNGSPDSVFKPLPRSQSLGFFTPKQDWQPPMDTSGDESSAPSSRESTPPLLQRFQPLPAFSNRAPQHLPTTPPRRPTKRPLSPEGDSDPESGPRTKRRRSNPHTQTPPSHDQMDTRADGGSSDDIDDDSDANL